jgi:hypothetical protein
MSSTRRSRAARGPRVGTRASSSTT